MKLIAASLLLGLALPLHAQTTNQQWDYQYGMAKFYFARSARQVKRGGDPDHRLFEEVQWLSRNYPEPLSWEKLDTVIDLETCETVLITAQLGNFLQSRGQTPSSDPWPDIQSCIEKGHVIPQ